MGPEHSILLRPRCPAGDDSDMGELLGLVAALLEVPALELELVLDSPDDRARYRFGEPGDATPVAEISRQGRFRAILHAPRSSVVSVPPATLDLIALALSRILSSKRLSEQVVLLRSALDTTTSAVLLFDATGAIVYANPPADRLLSRQTEDGLVTPCGHETSEPVFSFLCSRVEELSTAEAAGAAWRGTLSLSDGSALAAELLRIHNPVELPETAVLAVLQPLTATVDQQIETWAASHSLSSREAQVLGLLVKGLTSQKIAQHLGISPHTVRDHLKSLYRKSGCTSRGELQGLFAAPPVANRR